MLPASIIAIHTLNGHREVTWTAEVVRCGSEISCRQKFHTHEFVPTAMTQERTVISPYHMLLLKSMPQICFGSLSLSATNGGKSSLYMARSQLGVKYIYFQSHKRPIIFVAHSLGGILGMDYLLARFY